MASNTLHGVNLTGWLTLESWVTPELFAEAGALDEEQLAFLRLAAIVQSCPDAFLFHPD